MTMLLLAGCLINDALYADRRAALADADADGWNLDEGDCDDADAERHPEALDDCDGGDDDCDGDIDEDATTSTWFADTDGDGYGDAAATTDACAAPTGFVEDDTDCEDTDPAAHPGATEAWQDDGTDNDCDGDTYDPVVWDPSSATTRLDGPGAGLETGRRLAAWHEGGCLLVTAPYADESAGVVFAEPYGPGVRTAGGGGALTGPEPYAFLTGLDVRSDGLLVAGSLTNDGGRGRVWILDATELCAGAEPPLADAETSIGGASPDDFLGVQARWLADLDGDGLGDLAVAASGHDGADADEGAVAFFFEVVDGAMADADVVVTGGHAGAALEDVVRAGDRDASWLLFARTSEGPGGVALRRVPVDGLSSGTVDDLGDGGVAAEGTWLSETVAGDMDNDGEDEVVVGSAGFAIWRIGDLGGVVEEGDAPTRLLAGEDDEWLTGVAAIGDVDGGGRADLLLLADDWPLGGARGRLGVLPGETFLPGQTNTLAAQRLQATGAELGDAFGHRAVPVGDFDGDGAPDVAVAAYGADPGGSSSGSVYLLPLP